MKTRRNPNIELLRIVSMFMVLMLHANGHGGVIDQYKFGSLGYTLFWLIESFCMVSVNAFVLITGYYGTTSKFKTSKVLKFSMEIIAFSILCTILSIALGNNNVGMKEIFYSLVPLTSKRYWFASNYALLLFVQPVLNIIINKMDKETLKRFVLILIILFSVVPTFFIWNREITGTGMDITWFIVLYLVGAYIKLYGLNMFTRNRWFALYIILTGLLFISDIAVPGFTKLVLGSVSGVGIFNYYNTIFVFCSSVCFFMIFISREKSNRCLNTYFAPIGAYALGAYLVSDHRVIRSILWERINLIQYLDNPLLLLIYMVLVNIGIFALGIALDSIVKRILNSKRMKHLFNIIDRKIVII